MEGPISTRPATSPRSSSLADFSLRTSRFTRFIRRLAVQPGGAVPEEQIRVGELGRGGDEGTSGRDPKIPNLQHRTGGMARVARGAE